MAADYSAKSAAFSLFTSYFLHLSPYKACVSFASSRVFFFLLIKVESCHAHGLRFFFCLPTKRSKRTHSNRRSQRVNNKPFIRFYTGFYYSRLVRKCPLSYEMHFLYAETVNMVWFRFFYKDWVFAKFRRLEYIKNSKYVGWRYDLASILANRVYVYLEKKEILKKNKKRKNRKKVKVKNNLFNIGFERSFTITMQRFIIRNYASLRLCPR